MPALLPARPLARLSGLTQSSVLPAFAQAPSLLLRAPFSSTPLLSSKTGRYTKQPRLHPPIPSVHGPEPQIPSYPYGPRQVYKQSNTGLYGTARIRFGNIVSPKHEVKTRRKWRVNIHRKRLWSASLKAFVQTRVSSRVMRTIDKVGGLDEYLLGGKAARVKELGPWGWRLRWRVMQTPTIRARFAAQRRELGLEELSKEVEEMRSRAEAERLGGGSVEGMLGEVDAAIARGEEIVLGEEEGEGFMREDKATV